jgi:hypothetical protein
MMWMNGRVEKIESWTTAVYNLPACYRVRFWPMHLALVLPTIPRCRSGWPAMTMWISIRSGLEAMLASERLQWRQGGITDGHESYVTVGEPRGSPDSTSTIRQGTQIRSSADRMREGWVSPHITPLPHKNSTTTHRRPDAASSQRQFSTPFLAPMRITLCIIRRRFAVESWCDRVDPTNPLHGEVE